MEYKFRAWNKIDKVMITDLNSPVVFHGVLQHDEDDILMQFTGLTDKNGKDIYAGDIVDDMFDCGQLKIIYYNEESAGFYSKSIKTWPITGKYDLSISISPETITGGEVIGNIHQHSHLLDKGE